VTDIATHLGKKWIATLRIRRNWILATRSARCRHEVRKCEHVSAVILRIGNGIERRTSDVYNAFGGARRVLVRSGVRGRGTPSAETIKFVGYAHLIEVGIA
jgi:hypothetical protein